MVDVPETRYTRAPDGAFIAFQVFGSGPIDVLLMPGFSTNLDENWRIPEIADTHRRIGAFARVIAMDRRGVGLSDRLSPGDSAPLETHVDDLGAVLDAVKARDVCIVSRSVVAESDILTVRLSRTAFLDLVRSDPDIALRVMERLAARLRECQGSRTL